MQAPVKRVASHALMRVHANGIACIVTIASVHALSIALRALRRPGSRQRVDGRTIAHMKALVRVDASPLREMHGEEKTLRVSAALAARQKLSALIRWRLQGLVQSRGTRP
jgi:hypothetical protein